jgi:hypothetical protein
MTTQHFQRPGADEWWGGNSQRSAAQLVTFLPIELTEIPLFLLELN